MARVAYGTSSPHHQQVRLARRRALLHAPAFEAALRAEPALAGIDASPFLELMREPHRGAALSDLDFEVR